MLHQNPANEQISQFACTLEIVHIPYAIKKYTTLQVLPTCLRSQQFVAALAFTKRNFHI